MYLLLLSCNILIDVNLDSSNVDEFIEIINHSILLKRLIIYGENLSQELKNVLKCKLSIKFEIEYK